VWLDDGEGRAAESAEGICILAVGYGVDRKRYNAADATKIKESITVAYQADVPRHRLLCFAQEAEGTEERDRLATFGLQVWNDYSGHPDFVRIQGMPDATRPYMMGADMQETAQKMERMETVVGKQALLGPPRFGFKASEQEVMRLALDGMTDEAVANKLGLSLVAIKKRWQKVYEKIEDQNPNFWAEAGDDDGNALKQRRRQVLRMMAEHPEEFWAT
jgi:DNA-binding CsgD family transcriptional regulator